ncbi:SDR family NAD(P)-dependent oxidoreductase [Echinimonas agarilytica]|uniref:SDR family NAD(P)-dependent oxidoreductase n=1 Tax=Echinimonas agarilytica TaxID=1215918 RepID=A0AA41W3T8_9GAMM|nr:SDR family NAD(P)-dependent oxidoreductase [Echinimonas agarilytica]MCM2678301.1 SDR family NAD(P)-dependent oxidoreductase [Echinimonas agarilytica]
MSPKPVILMTGCSSGLGLALARQALKQSYAVIATARRVQDISIEPHENLLTLSLDVTQPNNIAHVMEQAASWRGQIDVLINNAGYGQMGALLDLSAEQLNQQLNTNVTAPIAMIKATLPLFPKRQGRVIQIGSVSAKLSTPFAGAYCGSKAALQIMSDALRMELSELGVSVCTVQLGAVASEFANNAQKGLLDAIPTHSKFSHLKHYIEARANASQQHPTAARDVAVKIIHSLNKPPTAYLKIANGSHALPLLALFPVKLTDWILKRKFGLN